MTGAAFVTIFFMQEELGITATSFADALTELGMGSSAK